MVKKLKISTQKSNQIKSSVEVSLNCKSESPLIQINNEPVFNNIEKIDFIDEDLSETDLDKNVDKTDSSRSNSLTSSSSQNSSVQNEGRNSKERDQKKIKKMKNKLSEEGQKHIAELIAYLHSDKPIIKKRVDLDDDELELVYSLDKAVDLDKFFEPSKKIIKDKLWKTPVVFKNNNTNNSKAEISENGFRVVNRFGEGVPDGCNISLSLAAKGRSFGDVFKKPLEWNDIIEEADEALFKYENCGKKRSKMGRRGSLLQPRFIFLSPHPEVRYERVLQSANCLPLREWTSELFLDSKESSELLDSETKRNLKWNASVEDFRHLLSPELSHFGNDVYSMIVQARRRQSLCPPRYESKPTHFRRQSYHNGQIWAPIKPNEHKKDDYEEKINIIRQKSLPQNNSNSGASQPKSHKSTNLLAIPSETSFLDKKKVIQQNAKHNDDYNSFSLDGISPKVIANELTLIAKELFLSIKNTEIITLLIRPNSINPDSCPGITALLGFQKRIIQLIASYILNESVTELRAQKMAFFIEVAEELKTLRNWYSVYSIISSLQSPPIARLRQSWQIITNEYSDLYCEYIELSELIKRESGPLDYASPSIPLFDDLMDNLKERCGSKYYEIKQHRLRSNWSKPETIAYWVEDQIVDLENVAQEKRKIQKRVERIHKDSNKEQNKGIFNRIRKASKSKDTLDSVSASSSTTSRNSSFSSYKSYDSKHSIVSDSQLIKSKIFPRNSLDMNRNSKSAQPSCKNIWSVADMQKLQADDEQEILQEIARGLVIYQNDIVLYLLEGHQQIAQNFLLLQSYDGMDLSMKKSLLLEPSKPSKSINASPTMSIESF